MSPPRRPTALGPVPAPRGPSAGGSNGAQRFGDDERTTVDSGPPQPSEDLDARWEEKTRREGKGDRRAVPRLSTGDDSGQVLRDTIDGEVTVNQAEQDEEVTVRADEEMQRHLVAGIAVDPEGSSEVGQTSTMDGTIDEPTVDEQAKPLPPLSVVPPIPAGKRSRPAARRPALAAGRLTVVAGNDSGREFDLAGKRVVVGRGVDCDLVLTDIAVSRRHLEIEFDGRFYRLRDLGSGNGTLLNDRIEDGMCELRHGDRMELGNTVLRFEHPASKPDPAAVGWGGQAEVDEEASTIAGRGRSSGGGGAKLPPPRRGAAEPDPRLVLPPSPPGAVVAANQPAAMRPIAARPIGPHAHGDPTLPPMAMPVSLPMGRQPTTIGLPDQRRLIIGIISATIVIVVIAIVATLIRGSEGDQVAANGQVEAAPASSGLADSVAGKTAAPSTHAAAASDSHAPEATLPASTWGTNEVLLASRAGVPAELMQQEVDPPAADDKKADDEKASDSNADHKKASDSNADHKKASDNNAGAPEHKARPTRIAKRATKRAHRRASQATPKLKRRAVKHPTRTARRARRRSSRSNNSASAARKKAEALYRRKDFNGAAAALRAAAKSASDAEADRLRAQATNYETVGVNMTRAQASETSNPTSSMSAYRRALALDKNAGDGAHAAYIRIKLGQVAPRAAASFMVQKKYELAKKAADSAVNYGAGANATVRRVRSALERKAADFYKQAIGIKRGNPNGAKSLLRRVLHIVPPDSPWYAKAYKLLNARSKPRDDDE